MAEFTGLRTAQTTTTRTSAEVVAGTARSRSTVALALAQVVYDNRSEAELDERHDEFADADYDDFPGADLAPDLGAPDDDEGFTEEVDERPVLLRTAPEIHLREGPSGIEWEIRATVESVWSDPRLAALALRRERTLQGYAAGLAADFLDPEVLGARPCRLSLIELWDALPTVDPRLPRAGGRWNTQAAIARRWDGTDATGVSRDRTLLIALPNGEVVPLGFFTWKTPNDALIARIASAENLLSGTIAAVMEAVSPSWLPAAQRRENTAAERVQRIGRDFVPWVRAAVRHRAIVSQAQQRFRSVPADFESTLDLLREALIGAEAQRVAREGGSALGKLDRALPVLERAIVGGL